MIGQKRVLAVIPARYGSTRFPGKPLVDIAGKSMVQRVFEQVSTASTVDKVVVATDDERIIEHVEAFGGNVVMTSSEHPSGTDRCFEALQKQAALFEVVVNVQGDEPFIQAEQVDRIALCFEEEQVEIATLVMALDDPEEHFESGMVFVTIDRQMNALYFSRAVIPVLNNPDDIHPDDRPAYHEHVGIYGYRSDILRQITGLGPSRLERMECLEQLRWLENGFKIRTTISTHASHYIDTPEDLDNVLKLIEQGVIKP